MKTQRVRPVSRSCFRAFLLLLVALCFLRLSSADASENYIFAVYPVHDPNRMLTAFQPLADFIAAETGVPVRLVVTGNYEEMTRRLADGSVHFAFFTSLSHLLSSSTLGILCPGYSRPIEFRSPRKI